MACLSGVSPAVGAAEPIDLFRAKLDVRLALAVDLSATRRDDALAHRRRAFAIGLHHQLS